MASAAVRLVITEPVCTYGRGVLNPPAVATGGLLLTATE
jgi:hypothetical protein